MHHHRTVALLTSRNRSNHIVVFKLDFRDTPVNIAIDASPVAFGTGTQESLIPAERILLSTLIQSSRRALVPVVTIGRVVHDGESPTLNQFGIIGTRLSKVPVNQPVGSEALRSAQVSNQKRIRNSF
jgi:hypothetical protein